MLVTVAVLAVTLSCGMCTFFNSNSCATNLSVCDPDQCCVGSGFIGQCQRLRQQGEVCETLPQRDSLNGNLYQDFCPCAPGLRCDSQGGIGIQLLGNCDAVFVPTTVAPNAVVNTANNAGTAVNNTAATVGNTAGTAVTNTGNTLTNATGALTNG